MQEINDDLLDQQSEELKNNLKYYDRIGQPIVDQYISELDDKITAIRDYLNRCREYNLDFDVPSLQRMVIDLSSTIYYTNDRLEKLNLLADMSKIRYKDKYNEAYLAKQQGAKLEDRKYTAEQLRAIADQEALEETVINFIYTRAAAVLKGKIDSANEVLKAVSKALSASITMMQQFNTK